MLLTFRPHWNDARTVNIIIPMCSSKAPAPGQRVWDSTTAEEVAPLMVDNTLLPVFCVVNSQYQEPVLGQPLTDRYNIEVELLQTMTHTHMLGKHNT